MSNEDDEFSNLVDGLGLSPINPKIFEKYAGYVIAINLKTNQLLTDNEGNELKEKTLDALIAAVEASPHANIEWCAYGVPTQEDFKHARRINDEEERKDGKEPSR